MRIKPRYRSVIEDFLFVKLQNGINAFKKEHPEVSLIDLGVGDVKLPPVKEVARALERGAKILADEKTFKGYSPDFGYSFLREKISLDYKSFGAEVLPDEVFVTDGAKGALFALFDLIEAERALILSPAYPLYKDLCVASGVKYKLHYSYGENYGFAPPPENFSPDVIFICSPCNPTGEAMSADLFKRYVDYANECGAIIIYDSAYRDFSVDKNCVFSAVGAANCVAEVCSYSKGLSFTGVRCGYVALKRENPLYKPYKKRELLSSNGVGFVQQYAAAVSYSKAAARQTAARVEFYRNNGRVIKGALSSAGAEVCGGINAPYLLLRTPYCGERFAARLLNEKGVAVTAGEGFGAENSVRISLFCSLSQASEAARRIADFYLSEKK